MDDTDVLLFPEIWKVPVLLLLIPNMVGSNIQGKINP